MTIAQTVDAAYYPLAAMVGSNDAATKRADILGYLSAACNLAFNEAYLANIQMGEGEVIDGSFAKTYKKVKVFYDELDRAFAELPITPMPLYKERGVIKVGTAFLEFIPTIQEQVSMFRFWQPYLKSTTQYRIENDLLYFENLSKAIEEVEIRIVPSADQLGDNDQLPVPAGSEARVIELLIAHFAPATQSPKDYTNNNKNNPNPNSQEG